MSSLMDSPVVEKVIAVGGLPAETNHGTSFTNAFLSACLLPLFGIFNLAAKRPIACLGRLWTNYYSRGAFGEEGVAMPGSALGFIIAGLLSFTEIKSQGQAEFPFQTHPRSIMVAITSLLMYGLASAAEQVISAARPGPTSVYVIIARLGRIGCLCILVGSLASLFYC